MRAFVAIELPEEVRSFFAREMAPLFEASLLGLRPVHPDRLHLTVKFLGEILDSAVSDATIALSHAVVGFSHVRLHSLGGGVYPGKRRPRVLWVGLDGEIEALQSLRDAVETSMKKAGFPEDARPQFRPHITLARFRADAPASTVTTALDHVRYIASKREGRFTVGGLSLMRSILSQSGAVYARLAFVPLANR